MDFLPDDIDDYSTEHTSKETDLLFRLNRETHQKILRPRMLSGHFQGRVLSMISKMIQPKHILEIGTYTGYSALCMAEGLQSDGILDTIDINDELQPIQNKYFEESGFRDQIIQHVGNALEIIPQLNASYDLVFIDADKENYMNYYAMVLPKIKKGGFILVDNVLWSGKVIENVQPGDLETQTLIDLNHHIQTDDRVENVLLPIRDGVMIVRVK